MANATRKPPVIVPDVIVLELTPDEAATLKGVTNSIGGDPLTSPRRHMDSISDALLEAGVFANPVPRRHGSIYFKNYPETAW